MKPEFANLDWNAIEPDNLIDAAWNATCDSETPLRELRDFAQALIMLSMDLEGDAGGAICTLATNAKRLCDDLEHKRGVAFHALHGAKFGGAK